MRRCLTAGGLLAMVFAAGHADASMLVTDTIAAITERSSLIVHVVCEKAASGYAGTLIPGAEKVAGLQPRTETVMQYSFAIRDVLVDRTAHSRREGDRFDLTQFAGFTILGGVPARPSVRLKVYRAGEEYILFLKEHGESFFTVGVDQGVFDVRDAIVSNPYMKFSLFRGMSPEVPGVSKALAAGKVSISAPPPSMPIEDFSRMISTLARYAKEGA